jgi:hypothetical protein
MSTTVSIDSPVVSGQADFWSHEWQYSQAPLKQHTLSATNIGVKVGPAVNWYFLFWGVFLFINVL